MNNKPAKIHPDPTWNDRALDMFEERRCNMKKHTNKNNNNKMTDDWHGISSESKNNVSLGGDRTATAIGIILSFVRPSVCDAVHVAFMQGGRI